MTLDGKTQCSTPSLRKFIHEQKKEREYAVEYQFGSICLFTAAFSAFLQSVQNLRQSLVPFATLLLSTDTSG
ncbi:hypothetical protein M3Y99_01682300 [Aphelenchoides fujianensis]|nr:hypothetical protein M3Y99_01682300 [Aphelenchoides fujianensis]